jgi:hypothetical protein
MAALPGYAQHTPRLGHRVFAPQLKVRHRCVQSFADYFGRSKPGTTANGYSFSVVL